MSEREAYEELCAYTLSHGDPRFIHQHVVDAFAAQHADENSKPIGLTFALVGLYLHVERRFTGRQVQRAHMTLARRKRSWPRFPLPADRGAITAVEVMAAAGGEARDRAISEWCAAVWQAFRESRPEVAALLVEGGIIDDELAGR